MLLQLHGGIYLDFDSLVLRNLESLQNALGLVAPSYVNGAVMAFDKGHPFLKDCLDELLTRFVRHC
jgi:mannosyltransferase OCH1-like enzyme